MKSIEKNWSGSLLIGLTSCLPTDKLRLPEMATSLDNSWIASSTDSGKMANVKHVNSLSKLQVCISVCVMCVLCIVYFVCLCVMCLHAVCVCMYNYVSFIYKPSMH